MSTLRVGNITATGGTGTITVPTGNRIAQAGAVLQVVSATKTDTFTTSSSTFSDIPGLSVTLTPNSSSSRMLVLFTLQFVTNSVNANAACRLLRDATSIAVGDAAGSRSQVTGSVYAYGFPESFSFQFFDSPATTSAVTYKLQVKQEPNGTFITGVNRSGDDANAPERYRVPSTITVMEIAG